MGILRALTLARSVDASAPRTHPEWSSAPRLLAVAGSGDTVYPVMVTRDSAMSVPAFRQGVNLIASTCGSFALHSTRADGTPVELRPVLSQPDPDEPVSVTWARVFTDLVLYPYAWMLVTERDSYGFPRRMVHLPAEQVTTTDEGRVVWRGADVTRNAKRFDNPNAPGALWDGARILTTALLIEDATRRYANVDTPSGILRQTGGPELTGEEIDSLLADWDAARSRRATAYLSQTLDYASQHFDPRTLQLVEARNANAADIARLLNLPPMYVNAESGSSMTYSNVSQQAQQLVNTTLTPYLRAVSGRLSMDDMLPHGTGVRFDLGEFLRADLATRAGAYATLIGAGVMTTDEARAAEGMPPAGSPLLPTTEGLTP